MRVKKLKKPRTVYDETTMYVCEICNTSHYSADRAQVCEIQCKQTVCEHVLTKHLNIQDGCLSIDKSCSICYWSESFASICENTELTLSEAFMDDLVNFINERI